MYTVIVCEVTKTTTLAIKVTTNLNFIICYQNIDSINIIHLNSLNKESHNYNYEIKKSCEYELYNYK